MLADFTSQLAATTLPEWCAVVLAIAYLLLAIRQSIWCWPCAFASTGLYIWLFHDVNLYMESALNLFYLLVALYGFWFWWRGAGAGKPAKVRRLSAGVHAIAWALIAALVIVSALLLDRFTAQANPFADAFTTWSAVWATWLTARKVLENWWYWLVIDLVSVWLYLERGLALTAALFILYLMMIPFGYLSWRRSEREAPA